VPIVLSFLLSKHLTAPIKQLISAIGEITSGNFQYRLNFRRQDEIGDLAEKFNHMAEKLSLINRIMTTLSSSLDLNQALKTSLALCREVLGASRGLILLNNSENAKIEIAIAENIGNIKIVENDCFIGMSKFDTAIPADFLLFVSQKPKIYFPDELKGFPSVSQWFAASECNCLAPLIVQNNIRGFLLLSAEKMESEFAKTFIRQIALTLENARLYNEAVTDGLTGLYIHRYFQRQLENEISGARRYNREFSLLFLDIDHFKKINDAYGHQTGDIILKTISSILKNLVCRGDLVARYGGEEIAIILPETGRQQAYPVAERIRAIVERYRFPQEISVTVSIGLTTFDSKNSKSKSEIIQQADAALYRAKQSGRNRVEIAIGT
jgi:diguanylate cyclase (GGDEF)-like protein